MKELLIVFLVLILILGGLFFWKGGHHAIALAEELEEWLDADAADQHLTLQLNTPSFSVEGGAIKPEVVLHSVSADTFWDDYGERRLYGVTAGGYTAFILDGVLFMDTGNAYILPKLEPSGDQLGRLAAGLLLYGRITKDGNVYQLTMEHEELSLSASVRVEQGVQAISVNAEFIHDGAPTALLVSLTPKQTENHPLTGTVLDAMVRASMETPMELLEPLGVLLPVLEDLLPLSADVTLGVECGILSLSETVGLTVEKDRILLRRGSEELPMTLPDEIDPMTAALAVLRNGTFLQNGDQAEFRIDLPPELTQELACDLIPQIRDLGLSFGKSVAVVQIRNGKLSHMEITADGTIPFLVTTIPLQFSAKFNFH